MKYLLLVFFLFFFWTDSIAQNDSVKINEDFQEVNLDKALQVLSRKYDYQFAYNSKVFKKIRVNIKINGLIIEETIKKLLQNTDYQVKKINGVYVFYPAHSYQTFDNQQVSNNLSWNSVVKDYESQEVLPYASIIVVSTGKGVASNEDGFFTLEKIPSDTSTILVSYVGYKPLLIKLNSKIIKDQTPVFLTQNSLIASVPIFGQREPMLSNRQTVQELDVNMIKTLPSVGDQDVFNSIQLLTGIDGTGERSGDIRIRGGAPDENLVVMDGFTLYHIDHFYQLYSTINASAIKHIRIHKGWFEPKFGGRASGIIEIQGKSGNLNYSKTQVGLNFNSANIFFESPLEQSKSSVVFTARKSIAGLYSSKVYQNQFNTLYNQSSPNLNLGNIFDSDNAPVFNYSDVNLKFNFLLSEKTKVKFSFFYSNDNLNLKQENEIPELGLHLSYQDQSDWRNKGYSMRWIHKWNDKWFSNFTLGYSTYTSKYLGEDVNNDLWFNTIDTIRNDKTTLLSDLTFRLNNDVTLDNHNLSFGLQHTANSINFSAINPEQPQIKTLDKGQFSSVYFQDKYSWKKADFLAGFRVNYYDVMKRFSIVPRLSITYQFHPMWTGKLFYGQNEQVIRNTQRQDLFLGIADVWALAGPDHPELKSTQFGFELNKKFEYFEISSSIYQREIQGALYNLENAPLDFDNIENRKFNIGKKNIQGIDLQFIKTSGKHQGWISISYLSVYHKDNSIIPYEFYDDFDQTIEGKIAYAYHLRKWNFGATFVYGSGKPYTAALGTYDLLLVNGQTKRMITYDLLNNKRLPAYHRLDLAATRYFFIKEKIGELGFAIFNVYNRMNTKDIRYYAVGRTSNNYELLEKKTPMMGFMPGIKFKFTF